MSDLRRYAVVLIGMGLPHGDGQPEPASAVGVPPVSTDGRPLVPRHVQVVGRRGRLELAVR